MLETGVSSFGKATAYGPLTELLRKVFTLSSIESRSQTGARLRAQILSLGDDLAPLIAPLCAVLDLPIEDFFWRELSAEEKHDRILNAVVALLQRLAGQKKLVLVIEDLHWIDGHSKAFIDRLIEGISAVPIFALVNFRPEFSHDWSGRSLFTQISLEPLEDEVADELAEVLLGGDPSIAKLKASLTARTCGMPFFLEEYVRSLFETGLLNGETGAYRLVAGNVDAAMAAVPATVQSVLAARIDRLSAEGKRLLQSAAVIGKDFSKQLLSASSDTGDDTVLQVGLEELQAAEFIQETRKLPQPDYSFKHALTQEVAYASLLKSERRELHCSIAIALKQDFPARCEDCPELLAHHLTEAGETAEAIDRWHDAGDKAARRVANAEACAHFERALALVPDLDEGPFRDAKEAALRIGYGVPQFSVYGAIAVETRENYARAVEVCRAIGDDERLFRAQFGQWIISHLDTDLAGMNRAAGELVRIADSRGDENMIIEAHHSSWPDHLLGGDFARALHHIEIVHDIYRPEEHHALTYEFAGHDPACCGHNCSSVVYWVLGEAETSAEYTRRCFDLALGLGHRTTIVEALYMALLVSAMTRDVSRVEAAVNAEAYPSPEDLSSERLLPYFEITEGMRDWVAFHRKEGPADLSVLRGSIEAWFGGGAGWGMPFLTLGAEALGEAGAAAEALALMGQIAFHNRDPWCPVV